VITLSDNKESNVNLEKTVSSLREKLKDSLMRNSSVGLLFSGGIDSGILAYLCPKAKALSVTFENEGEDLEYGLVLARDLQLDRQVISISVQEALSALGTVIKILESFDPALPNDLVVYFGMREAKKQGLNSIMTGDGGDELFAGYPYMQEIEDLEAYIRGMNRLWSFSSISIGEHFSLEVKQPFLDADFVDFAVTVPGELKIREDKGQVWGKWCLRKAFEPFLPPAFIWQSKRPLEMGSGMTNLRSIIAGQITDREFAEKQKQYPVKFLCKEHLYFYELYREEVGKIPPPQEGEDLCPGCGGGLPKGKKHCRICGAVL
jgi:asparagine synthase (glutamine-hydrolysing)